MKYQCCVLENKKQSTCSGASSLGKGIAAATMPLKHGLIVIFLAKVVTQEKKIMVTCEK